MNATPLGQSRPSSHQIFSVGPGDRIIELAVMERDQQMASSGNWTTTCFEDRLPPGEVV